MIRFDAVRARYPGQPEPTVDSVSFEAGPGLITAVVGPNGSGKTTLVRALLGRVSVESGKIELSGTPLDGLDRRAIARAVAVVPQQEDAAFPRTVGDFVALGRYAHGSPWRGPGPADTAAVAGALDRTGLARYADRRTDQLSGGEWQRVRVARALAQATPSLVLDEPNSFLDIAHEMALFELLDDIAREGTAVLLISHQLNLVARFAARIVLLSHGRVVADGPPSTVMQGSLLERVYRWPVVVSLDAAVGAPMLVPLRRRAPR